jgi:hypothetical protein
MGAHTWHTEPASETPLFDAVALELLERRDSQADSPEGELRHGCLDAPID